MSRKEIIQQLHIASPCTVDWDSMIGNDRVRFCEHCRLSVHHGDFLTNKQLRRLIARSHGRLCVNYTRPSVETEVSFPILHKIGRRTSALAAGAFSATLGISTVTAATQPNFKQPLVPDAVLTAAVLNEHFSTGGTGSLRGRVFDPNGAVIPNAKVVVTNSDTTEQRNTSTNDEGEYVFEGLPPGTYTMSIESPGFTRQMLTNIDVQAGNDRRMDQTLTVSAVTGGAVAMVMPSDPLVKAAMEDDLEAVNAALTANPNPNVRDKETQATALEHAVYNGNREMVQVLLWSKADVNAKDDDGQTALMMLSAKVTTEIVWDLVNAGAKVNLRDKDGDTPLISTADEDNVDALRALLDAGATVDASNNDGETALMKAASNGLVNNVRTLIMAGANVNARDKEGKTALTYANESDEAAVARLLKAHGAIEFEVKEKQ
jgi:Carboxypeptidase regulatory-like domain/Ankyrin repeats (3 copies)/Ankyrin repeats (many copies)